MKATRTVSGEVVSDIKGRASGQDQVITAATKLVASVRKALGDETKESDQMFAMTSLSASSLEVVRYYAAAQEAASNNKFEDARQNLLKAVELDPKFGVGYLALAGVSRNLQQLADAREVRQPGDEQSGQHDRARALHDARHVVPAHLRLQEVRRRAQPAHREVQGGHHRPQPAGAVRVESAGSQDAPAR